MLLGFASETASHYNNWTVAMAGQPESFAPLIWPPHTIPMYISLSHVYKLLFSVPVIIVFMYVLWISVNKLNLNWTPPPSHSSCCTRGWKCWLTKGSSAFIRNYNIFTFSFSALSRSRVIIFASWIKIWWKCGTNPGTKFHSELSESIWQAFRVKHLI